MLLKMYAFAVSLTLLHALLNCKNKFFFVIFSSSHHAVLSSLSVKNFPLFANEKHLTDNFSSDNYFQQQRKTYECMHAKWVRMFKTFLEQWYLELHNKSRFFLQFCGLRTVNKEIGGNSREIFFNYMSRVCVCVCLCRGN